MASWKGVKNLDVELAWINLGRADAWYMGKRLTGMTLAAMVRGWYSKNYSPSTYALGLAQGLEYMDKWEWED